MNDLNLSPFLKNCIGERFYSIWVGKVTLTEVDFKTGVLSFEFTDNLNNKATIECNSNGGQYPGDECGLYPSILHYRKFNPDARRAWAEWVSDRYLHLPF